MDDRAVLERIRELVEDEERLRARSDAPLTAEERARLEELEEGLDQCWDYLRQRRALRRAGRSPDDAAVRPPEVVEDYEQQGVS
jgi:hypothetical protein